MLALSWGKNLMPLTDFFLENVPGYNKFRTVSTTLVIVELLIPFLGILALNKIIKDGKTNEIMNSFQICFRNCWRFMFNICLNAKYLF